MQTSSSPPTAISSLLSAPRFVRTGQRSENRRRLLLECRCYPVVISPQMKAKIMDFSLRGLVRIVFKPIVNEIPLIGGVQVRNLFVQAYRTSTFFFNFHVSPYPHSTKPEYWTYVDSLLRRRHTQIPPYCVLSSQVYFLTPPDIDFDLGGIANAFDVPGLSNIIRKIVLEQGGNDLDSRLILLVGWMQKYFPTAADLVKKFESESNNFP